MILHKILASARLFTADKLLTMNVLRVFQQALNILNLCNNTHKIIQKLIVHFIAQNPIDVCNLVDTDLPFFSTNPPAIMLLIPIGLIHQPNHFWKTPEESHIFPAVLCGFT